MSCSATIVEDVDPSSITSRTPELGAVGWFSPDDLPETDPEASDVISLIKQVERPAACSFADEALPSPAALATAACGSPVLLVPSQLPLTETSPTGGRLAQLARAPPYKEGVGGSSPSTPTTKHPAITGFFGHAAVSCWSTWWP